MKKKITLTLIGLICALCCAFNLAACDGKQEKEFQGIVAASPDNPSLKTSDIDLGKYTYGEDEKINAGLAGLKFYKYYSDGSCSEEIAVSELDIKYYYGGDTSEDRAKPDKYYARSGMPEKYSFTYSTPDAKNPVMVVFEVKPSASGNFSITLSKTQWKYGEDLATVTLKNPAGLPVKHVEDTVDGKVAQDDTIGAYDVGYIAKDIYDTFTEQQKTDFNFYLEKVEYSRFDRTTPVDGEYMLFAVVYNTHNYEHIVTPAVKFTVRDAITERTFKFLSVSVQDSSGNPVNDKENEYVNMAEDMTTGNQGATVICKTNGEVRGTVDFGGGAFDGLSDQEVYKYEKTGGNKIALKQGNSVVGEGVLAGDTFTLKMPIDENYYFVITFAGQ